MSSLFGGASPGQAIMGGSASQSQSNNQAYPYLQGALSPQVAQSGQASTQMGNMLGLNGTQAQNQGFQNFQNSTGYQFGLNQGLGSITGNAATSGLLNSGGTLKAMDTYGQNYANTQYGNYMSQLQGLLGSGNQAASIIGNTGQQSSANSSESKGMGGFIGQLLGKGSGGGG